MPNGLKARLVQLAKTVYLDPDSLGLARVPQLSRISQCTNTGIAVGLPSGHPEQHKHASWRLQASRESPSCVCCFLRPG